MAKFSEKLRASPKRHNHPAARDAKVTIRRSVLVEIGAEAARVFDAYAGAGEMFHAVWRAAADYVGCDKTWFQDERRLYVADNLRVLRAVDLGRFTIFDLDAFGSPWEAAIIIAARRRVEPGERVGIVLTDGSGLKIRQGGIPKGLAELSGLRGKPAGLTRWQDDVTDMAIASLCRRMQAQVIRRSDAVGTTGARVRYIGLVIEGVVKADAVKRDEPPVQSARRRRSRARSPAATAEA